MTTVSSDSQESESRQRDVRLADLGVRHVWPLWAALAMLMYTAFSVYARRGAYGIDSHAYWLTGHHADLYWRPARDLDAYLYSPAFAQIIHPLTLLPWPVFYGAWVCIEAAAFAWLLKPLGWAWGVPAFLLCGLEVYQGNVIGILGVVLVLGLRRLPEVWAFAALTKVTIALGPIWFLARGEWRNLARAAIATLAIAGVSFAVAPAEWAAWLRLLVDHQHAEASFVYRLAGGVAMTIYAARSDRPWLLAPAMVLATPITQGAAEYLTLLAAVPRLLDNAGSAAGAITPNLENEIDGTATPLAPAPDHFD